MKQVARNSLVVWIVVVSAVGSGAQSPGFSAADSKELASYRLTMDTVKKVHAAMRSLIEESKKDPKVRALMATESEIEALEKKEELTDAEGERLEKLRELREQQDQAVEADDRSGLNMNDAKSLDQMEAVIKKSPQMSAALTQAGLTAREFSKFTFASLMAGMVAGFQKSGMVKDLPTELKEVHADNVKFMLEHEAELTAMQRDLQALTKGGR